MLRTRLEEIDSRAAADKEWWDKRREAIQKDFMKELDGDSSTKGSTKGASDDDAVLVDSATPASTPASKKKKGGKK